MTTIYRYSIEFNQKAVESKIRKDYPSAKVKKYVPLTNFTKDPILED